MMQWLQERSCAVMIKQKLHVGGHCFMVTLRFLEVLTDDSGDEVEEEPQANTSRKAGHRESKLTA